MSQPIDQFQELETYDAAQSKFLTPFQRKALLKQLQSELQSDHRRRIEIMLLADMGKSQAQICRALDCSQEMARYWSTVAEAGLAHKWQQRRSDGRPKQADDRYLERLRELVSHNPRDYGYGFQRWTAQWLSKHLANEFGITISARHVNRLLKQMGLSTKPMVTGQRSETGITISDLSVSAPTSLLWSFDPLQPR